MLRNTSSRELLTKAGEAGGKLLRHSSSQALLQKGKEQVQRQATTAGKGLLYGGVSGAGAVVSGTALSIARKVYPGYCDPISANIINEDPDYTMNVHALVMLRDQAPVSTVKKQFADIANTFERFRQRVVVRKWGWPYWETQDFNIDDHIVEVKGESDIEAVQQFVTKELSVPLPPEKPLWRVYLFSNFKKDDGTIGSCLCFKYNHVIADGYHIMRVLLSNIMERFAEQNPETFETIKSKQGSDRGQNSMNMSKLLPALAKLVFMQDDPPSAVKAPALLSSTAPRTARWATSKSSVDDIKPIVKKMGDTYTINDALFGCLSTAITKFAEKKGTPLKEDVTAVIWVALKAVSDVYMPPSVLPVPEPDNSTLSNVYLKFPRTNNNADATKQINERFSGLKGSPEPILAQGLRSGFGVLPKTLTNVVWPALSNKVSLSVSSLPGPSWTIEFCDTVVDNVAFWVPPVGSISLFVTVMTFNGKMSISISADETVANGPELASLAQSFVDEIDAFVQQRPVVAQSKL